MPLRKPTSLRNGQSPSGLPQPWGTRYARHRAQAKYRGEPYELTAQEYYDVWCQSGVMAHCGRTHGGYSLYRIDIRKPWQVGNITVITRRQLGHRLGRRYYQKDYLTS